MSLYLQIMGLISTYEMTVSVDVTNSMIIIRCMSFIILMKKGE